MKNLLLAIIGGTVVLMCTGVHAQYALDHPMADVHTKAGLGIIVAQCRPDLPVIHFVTSERRGDKKYAVTSSTQCVPKSGTNVLALLCDFATNTCKAGSTPQRASELEAAFRQGTFKEGQRL
ncbi:MAG: hypothetical protein KBB77_02320 [Candidatus Moranbacteria bacterium]|nr:hypothetical protein [Candidatus Moranbacteria bacterium]